MPAKKTATRKEVAKRNGKKIAMFEITEEFDAILEHARKMVAVTHGRCSRVQALEWIGREWMKSVPE